MNVTGGHCKMFGLKRVIIPGEAFENQNSEKSQVKQDNPKMVLKHQGSKVFTHNKYMPISSPYFRPFRSEVRRSQDS